ncbi:Mis12-Mtw1 protein family-domain-containing protein [Coniochaeta sp. 2T2.1]|nr:Mis12-Mtw1 protein family-domain-containing protein [Coniochaeta sp. 2T2.1]
MTTLVRTARQPLSVLSMGNEPTRRKSKRLAVSYDEQDGDFVFTRAAKKVKTAPSEPENDEEPAPVKAKKTTSSRPPKSTIKKRAVSPPPGQPEPASIPLPPQPSTRRSSRRSSQQPSAASQERDEPQLVVPKARATARRTTRASIEREKKGQDTTTEEPQPARTSREPGTPAPEEGDSLQSHHAEGQKIALPFSDTPVQNRNKDFRKKGGNSQRRSSLGMRGRRASSLIDNGHSAIPHKEVDASEFYKHIEEGMLEVRRMKQLLVWCGERALSEKPPHGSRGTNGLLAARAMQDLLLKDLSNKPELSDWFGRESVPKPPAILKPNPRNIEHDAKIAELEAKVKRLQEEKKAWKALTKPIEDVPPLQLTISESDPTKIVPPDPLLLDPEEAAILSSLSDPSVSFSSFRKQTVSKIKEMQSSLEFKVDHLADNVHKLDQRVITAGRQADRVLALASDRLKEREEREKKAAGTSQMPVVEVLRSLSRILPEGG